MDCPIFRRGYKDLQNQIGVGNGGAIRKGFRAGSRNFANGKNNLVQFEGNLEKGVKRTNGPNFQDQESIYADKLGVAQGGFSNSEN